MNVTDLLKKLTIRINRSGSGVIFLHPFDDDNIYIFTAKHCLKNGPFELVEYELIEAKTFKPFIVTQEKIFIAHDIDFALLLVSKSDFQDLLDDVLPTPVTSGLDHLAKYHFRGYPAAFNNENATRLEAVYVEEIKKGIFKLRTSTSLSDSSGNLAIDTVSGFSGSGVFIEINTKVYICGLVTEIGNEAGSFNEINCLGFVFLNSFLVNNGLPEIEVSEKIDKEPSSSEKVYTNLLETTFPETVYLADVNFSRNEIIKLAQETNFFPYDASPRRIIFEAMRQTGDLICGDWATSNNKILTFHNLVDGTSPISRIIDKGTVTSLSITDFYDNQEKENFLKSLLHNYLAEKLRSLKVYWKARDHLFVFMPTDLNLEKRELSWVGKKKATRTVFEAKMKSKVNETDPDKIDYCKHLAFSANFQRFEQSWYLQINPDWYVSYNGKDRHNYKSKSLISFWKRQERNAAVFNHLRFLQYFLSNYNDVPPVIHGLLTGELTPGINDVSWKL